MGSSEVRIIVRADDIGSTHDRNVACLRGAKEGPIRYASLMPIGSAFLEAVEMCNDAPTLSSGIHLAIINCVYPLRPLSDPADIPSLVTPDGFFFTDWQLLLANKPQREHIEIELRAQVAKAHSAGLDFGYLDYHHGVTPDMTDVMHALAREEGVWPFDSEESICGHFGCESIGYLSNIFRQEWPKVMLPDGNHLLSFEPSPGYSEEERAGMLQGFRDLQPGTWFDAVHPGYYSQWALDLTDFLCCPELKTILDEKPITVL